jgi:hypothetical protein
MLPSKIEYNFPSQKKSTASKNEQWRKQCIDSGETACLWRNEGVRSSIQNKTVNYNLYSDLLDEADVEKVCNPMKIVGLQAPAKMQNYPISNPKIDLLVGESINRKFDFKARVVNQDAISRKGEQAMDMFREMFISHLKNKELTDEQMEKELKNFQEYLTYDFQDAKEKIATDILSYLTKSLNLDYLFAKGFKDALICAEEIYHCDVIAGEPIVKRLNPKNVHTVRSGESPYIEDSDIITIVEYYSPGQVIDEYHEELNPAEISRIENSMAGNVTAAKGGIDIGRKPELPLHPSEGIDISALANDFAYGSPFDNNGNIKVTKVFWKSLRKVKKVKYYDEEGDVQYDIYDENYVIDVTRGEEETVLWISEWWEGHKIGGSIGDVSTDAIYVRMRPKPVQFRKMENPSICHPGIVGTIYNTNDNKGVSLMDRMKPLQYLYNVLAYNVELMIAKNKGKIMRVNVAEIPENWKIDKWLSYVSSMNLSFYDPFKEGNKGAATGKLAGSMNQSTGSIDAEMGNSIQMYINMMDFIKRELGEISGVSASRQGQIHNRSAVGNVQQEINQTSHITEYWFMEHDFVKKRVLECLLDTAKYAWRNNQNKKVQYVLGDGASKILEINGPEFASEEYGLLITNGNNTYELLQVMKQTAQMAMQAGKMKFSQLIDIYSDEALATIRRKIINSEMEAEAAQQKQAEQASKIEEMKIAEARKMAEDAKDFKREEWDREDVRLDKELEAKYNADNDTDFIDNGSDPETLTLTLEKLKNDAEKIRNEYAVKMAQLAEEKRKNRAQESLKSAEIASRKSVNK